LAKLKKESAAAMRRGKHEEGVKKEGDAQICLVGKTMSGKSWLLQKLTDAKPELASHPFTTTAPAVGMMDWRGVKIQLIEIPATFDARHMSLCRTADAVALVANSEADKAELEELLDKHLVRKPRIFVNPWSENPESIRQRLGAAVGLIVVYTKAPKGVSPMALPAGSAIRTFAERIHKDFVKRFRFAFLWRTVDGKRRRSQVGLDYILQDGDIVELHMK
ncbi:MAG: TGS domain-containing protein, partial [Candidatus Aenigmatarchaeota archaeon]